LSRSSARAETPLAAILREVEQTCLRPHPAEVAEAHVRADRLIEELSDSHAWMFEVDEVIDHGSLSRGTGLRSFKDIDKLVILNSTALLTTRGQLRSPSDTVTRMARTIAHRRGGLVALGAILVRRQTHSVGIVYLSTGFRIDLVPALKTEDGLLIPDRRNDSWITTYPEAYRLRLERAEEKTPHTRAAIGLLKGWSRARGRNVPLSSFAIETLIVEDALRRGPVPLDTLLFDFFQDLANRDARQRLVLAGEPLRQTPVTLLDPVSGANLAEYLESVHRRKLIGACRSALRQLDLIRRLTERGQGNLARTAARMLFVGARR
jgi:hypothetical protein